MLPVPQQGMVSQNKMLPPPEEELHSDHSFGQHVKGRIGTALKGNEYLF